MKDRKAIIVPLDFNNERDALDLADRLNPDLCRVKVGKELFTSAGPHVVRELQARGFDVFLDLKFHDIPNTVAGAISAACSLGVWMVNVHVSGGVAMLKAARDAVDEYANKNTSHKKPLLIGVTILTSLNNADITHIGFSGTALDNVLRFAKMAQDARFDGVVCSAAEASSLRKIVPAEFKLVTPGIRPTGDVAGDQQRVVTPTIAMADGSDYLVIGRPISQADDPAGKLALVQQEIDTALAV